ncbi:B3GA3-like protein [Mya arenaria]|uniref:Galactosylgalactosylxylosylprotein 3-beta-glucuronosyltransferase n=1 Tax=Mya arenaria TaxID=6604 RepID=A0ABY7FCB2_MYAAR|nr:B3GA3-like protein [Mya arenaria]
MHSTQLVVVGWHTSFRRKISTDMAGFAVSLHMLEDHARAQFRATAASGYLEVDFIQQLGVTLSDLEPRADDCTKTSGDLQSDHEENHMTNTA